MAADLLNVRHQAARLDMRKQFYSQRVVDMEQSADKQTKSVIVNSFKKQRRIGGSHIESQDWRKDEADVLLESTIVPVGPTRLNLQVSKQCSGSRCLSRTPDQTFFPSRIPDTNFFPSRVQDPESTSKNLSILIQKIVFKLSEL
jgi:hypothetical protein